MDIKKPAVFLSYASQDAAAAALLCEALRSGGIEVWFDQSELRGGDAWDAAIRSQIKACALFIAVISRTTQTRDEGYFRLEWKLAVDRSYLMAGHKPFLLPVVIDDIRDGAAQVPDRFREVQWTRLPGGRTPPSFVERVTRLLMPEGAIPQSTSEAVGVTSRDTVAAWSTPRPSSPLRWVALGLVAAGCIGAGVFLWSRRTIHESPAAAPAAASSVSGIPEKSIAVLPLLDMSEKKDQEYFSDGLSEELLDLLAQVQDLRVAARTSSFYFKGRSDDIATIAQKLRVANVLEGSVRKSGDTVRVTVQLIRADNGYHLWSKTYDRQVKDIFKVQDEIASAVVAALKLQLLPAQQLASRHRTDNTAAYNEYLLGNQLRTVDDFDSNTHALAAYQRAIALDPGYAAAYSGLSDAEWRVADSMTNDPAAFARATAAAEKAVALAPDSPEGYWARGQVRNFHDYDRSGAEADYQKALALDPNIVRAKLEYATLLAALGRMPEAIALTREAIVLDPLSLTPWRRLAWLLVNTGQYAEARVASRRMVEINAAAGDRGTAGYADLFEGHAAEALKEFEGTPGPLRPLQIAMAQYSLGHPVASEQALSDAIKEGRVAFAYQYAEVYAWRGEKDKAFEWLDTAYRIHDGGLLYTPYDRSLAKLRDDPRYDAFLHKLKLAQ